MWVAACPITNFTYSLPEIHLVHRKRPSFSGRPGYGKLPVREKLTPPTKCPTKCTSEVWVHQALGSSRPRPAALQGSRRVARLVMGLVTGSPPPPIRNQLAPAGPTGRPWRCLPLSGRAGIWGCTSARAPNPSGPAAAAAPWPRPRRRRAPPRPGPPAGGTGGLLTPTLSTHLSATAITSEPDLDELPRVCHVCQILHSDAKHFKKHCRYGVVVMRCWKICENVKTQVTGCMLEPLCQPCARETGVAGMHVQTL